MALLSWKSFPFFERLKPVAEDANAGANITPTAGCAGTDSIFLGYDDGTISQSNRDLQRGPTFKQAAPGSINHMRFNERLSMLVTIAEDGASEPTLRVWSVPKAGRKGGEPSCLSTINITNNQRHFPVSAFAYTPDLSQIAVGFANGSIALVRGDVIHDRGTKQRIVFETEEPITGLAFRVGKSVVLYISTTTRVIALTLASRNQRQTVSTLDHKGADVNCTDLDGSSQDFIVARDDALSFYHLHGRRAVYNCDGRKFAVAGHGDYIALLAESDSSTISKSLPTVRIPDAQSARPSTLVILNTNFQMVAHVENLPDRPVQLLSFQEDFVLVTSDGKMLRYREKSLEHRLGLLTQRNLFVLAIQLAQKAGVSRSTLNSIYRDYGDYLYKRRDYDTAMQQYLRAIDDSEPSQVIRKLHNLVAFLEELQEQGSATSDHTLLLLNCYAKLKEVNKLDAFVRSSAQNFDPSQAIALCRQSGYPAQAAYLARKQGDHDVVMAILIQDLKKYEEALTYVWRLDAKLACENTLKYAATLLDHFPEQTTQLMVALFTGEYRTKTDTIMLVETNPATTNESTLRSAVSAVQSLVSIIPLPHMSSEPQTAAETVPPNQETRILETTEKADMEPYDIPRPREAFSSFLEHPKEFREFLEACVQSPKISKDDLVDVYLTLLEMYLQEAQRGQSAESQKWHEKIRAILHSSQANFNPTNVLLLSEMKGFEEGSLHIREQQGLRGDIFRSYIAAKDTSGAIRTLQKYGSEEPELYPAALAYFTSNSEVLAQAGDQLKTTLQHVSDKRLMAPLEVVQTLCANPAATMAHLKPYLEKTIREERNEISRSRTMITALKADSDQTRAQLKALTTEPQTLKATRCSSCGYALDQPSVHFLCEHAYHQRCLESPDTDVNTMPCPSCASKHESIRMLKQAQEAHRDRHDLFVQQLGRTQDKFLTIAEWYGRGVMSAAAE